MAQPKPKPAPKRTWKNIKGKVHCYSSPDNDCFVLRLWQADRSDFHDAKLQDATAKIQKILELVDRRNEDSSRCLSIINIKGRLMLVWTHPGGAGRSDTLDDRLAKRLKLKGRAQSSHKGP